MGTIGVPEIIVVMALFAAPTVLLAWGIVRARGGGKGEPTLNGPGPTYEPTPSLFSYRGRMRRTPYAIQMAATLLPAYVLGKATGSAFIWMVLWIGAAVMVSFPQVRRLHDVNLSGGWYWCGFFPIANVVLGLYSLFARGTAGPNRYGPDPRDAVAGAESYGSDPAVS